MANIPLRDRKLLWYKSGGKCGFDGCRRSLAVEVEQSGRTSIVSQEAHIVAEEESGPRGHSALSKAERNSYANLILLCLEHHKIVDDDPETFTVDVLLDMKSKQETWFDSLRSPEEARAEARQMLMINIIDEWEERADIDHWRQWVSGFLWYRLWIYSRAWPDVFPTLPRVFENFSRVADDLRVAAELALTHRSELPTGKEEHAREYIPDHKRHDIRRELTEEAENESIAEAEWVRDLFGDLALELTRAANWILDEVRIAVDPRYQADLGVLLVQREVSLASVYDRPRYLPAEIAGVGYPYEGVRAFLLVRNDRDMVLGTGFNSVGFKRMTPFYFGVEDDYGVLEALNQNDDSAS